MSLRDVLDRYRKLCVQFQHGGMNDELELVERAIKELNDIEMALQSHQLRVMQMAIDDFADELHEASADLSIMRTHYDLADVLECVLVKRGMSISR
jgi:hypothetical protein